jgi:hypothetical protein
MTESKQTIERARAYLADVRGGHVSVGDADAVAQVLARYLASTLDILGHQAAALDGAELSTVLAALDEAAEYKRDRAANCPDCDADPELCGTCEYRLGRAGEYDALAARLAEAQR